MVERYAPDVLAADFVRLLISKREEIGADKEEGAFAAAARAMRALRKSSQSGASGSEL